MSTPINARDAALQQIVQRVLNIPSNYITIVSPNLEARYDVDNLPVPSILELTVVVSGPLQGTPYFEVTGLLPNTDLVIQNNKLLLDPQTFAQSFVTVTAKLDFEGTQYVSVPVTAYRTFSSVTARLSRTFDLVQADSNGNSYDLPPPNLLELYNGTNKLTAGVIFGPLTQVKNGLTCNVNSTTGAVTLLENSINTWNTDYETFTLTATINSVVYTVSYSVNKVREGGTGIDLTPPPTPTGFKATAGINIVLVEHDRPEYLQGHGHSRTVLYGKEFIEGDTLTPFNPDDVIAEFTGNIYALPSEPGTTWRLWAKWVSEDGGISTVPAGGTDGLTVTRAQDMSKLLDVLTGEITETQLYSELAARIDLIDDPVTGLVKTTADLTTVFGTTASAAASALEANQAKAETIIAQAAAENSASTATTQAQLATDAKNDASDFASNAGISESNAAASATSASDSASTATTQAELATSAKNDAIGSASSASISATNAATSASSASDSASTATTQAGLATDAKNDAIGSASSASISATNAATSETNAAGSALSAASSVNTLQATIRGTLLSLPVEQWVLNGQSIVQLADGIVGSTALRLSGAGDFPNQGNYIPLDRTKKYRTRFWARPSDDNTAGELRFSLRQFIDDTGTPGPVSSGRSPVKFNRTRQQHLGVYGNTWGEYVYTWVSSDWQEGVKFIQPEFFDNFNNQEGYWDIQGFTLTDVTETEEITAAVQTLATTVAGPDGATAQYTVKADINGYVAGFGLSNTSNIAGETTSSFTIVADKFTIAPVSTSNTADDGSPFFHSTVPITINGVSVPAGTYMKAAYIHDASITTAKIQDLAVDNAKIATLDASKINAGFISADRIDASSITASKLNVDNLSAINADMGIVTAGRMQSADGTFIIDLTNKFISISI
jgi:hypothetical protein